MSICENLSPVCARPNWPPKAFRRLPSPGAAIKQRQMAASTCESHCRSHPLSTASSLGCDWFSSQNTRICEGRTFSRRCALGGIRPVIQELADQAGAYIIVSSKGSVADTALRNRRDALRDGLAGVPGADDVHTDFYDRTRLATWTRRHPGLVAWVKEKVGRAFVGWRPYGPWSGGAETIETEYLLDDKLRLHLGRQRQAPAQPVAHAIDDLRDELAQPGKMVRLVGLSGVGKTRLVQALFDARIGERPLPPWLAVYTNLSDNPDPQPTGWSRTPWRTAHVRFDCRQLPTRPPSSSFGAMHRIRQHGQRYYRRVRRTR